MVQFPSVNDNGTKPPKAAFWLGVAGVVPFVISALGLFFIPSYTFLNGLLTVSILAYGAVILSFLGGVRWGVALFFRSDKEKATELIMSVVPTLIA